MKKQVCSSLLALTMTMGTVAPAMASEVEVNVQSAECTCTTACTEDNRNTDCAICGAEGAQLTDCAQVTVQDNANDEPQDTNAENGFEYAVNEDGESVTLTKYTGSDAEVIIPSELGGKPVTAIGNKAFRENTTITSVNIPEGVTSIGDGAFYGCSSLVGITIPDSVTTIQKVSFAYCTALTSITIPKNVSRIETGTFSYCTALESITLPKGLTFIDSNAFQHCGNALKTVNYGGKEKDWEKIEIDPKGNDALLAATRVYATVKVIQEGDFQYTVTGEDEAAIAGYTGSAKNIVIPSELGGKKITAIWEDAFEGYANMRYVYIPKSITAIGENAFSQAFDNDSRRTRFVCYEGTQDEWNAIDIKTGNGALSTEGDYEKLVRSYECGMSGDMVYQVSDDAAILVRYFGSDSKVNIPAELGGKPVTIIGECAFSENSSLTEVTIPEGVKSMGMDAFTGCASLTNVLIPESVESIESEAFWNCSSLAKITIPEGVDTINSDIFRGCSKLKEITIPKSVKSIEDHAFYGCEALQTGTVYYGGTQEDWDALKKNIDIDGNDPLLNAPNIIFAIQESDGFEYTVTGDEATITGCTGSAKNIVIPSELGGKKVTAIADKAFYGYGKMRDIYIPKTIKTIGENAFQNAVSAEDADKRIRFICYEGTATEWADINIQGGNNAVRPEDEHLRIGVCECRLSDDMVYQASDDAATLARYFGSDSKVKIPAELGGKPVSAIGEYAFALCNSLTEVTLPEGVESIGDCSFWLCTSLTEATIPKSVKSIGYGAFGECTSLKEVTIPKSVTSIGDSAFYACKALETVYYGGTQEDWEALKKNIDIDGNDPLLNANIICKEKPKICKGGKEVDISNGTHEMRIHGKSYGTFTFAWVNDEAGWSIQNADGKYLSFDNGKLILSDTAYVWKYDAKFYTTTEEKTTSSGWNWGWGWWGRPSTTTKTTNWYLVGDGENLSVSKSASEADMKLYDAIESTEHSFSKWTPAEEGKHTRTCTICGETETGDCTYENGACTVCGALDPDHASVSVSATVTKRTSDGGGWWWWSRPTTTTWQANITATGTGVDIDKVEYSEDGKYYLTGTSFTSETEITKFYIRVTDSKGNVTNWLYENGKVTQK